MTGAALAGPLVPALQAPAGQRQARRPGAAELPGRRRRLPRPRPDLRWRPAAAGRLRLPRAGQSFGGQPQPQDGGYGFPAPGAGQPQDAGFGQPSPFGQQAQQAQQAPLGGQVDPASARPRAALRSAGPQHAVPQAQQAQPQDALKATAPLPGPPPAPAPAAEFAPFWFAVPAPRQLAPKDGAPGPFVGDLVPGTWYLAVEQRGAALVAQLQDGTQGVLNDVSGIQRG